ncbi:MAG: DUF5677 domain-containing protein [Sedimentisphaerales bacterium]
MTEDNDLTWVEVEKQLQRLEARLPKAVNRKNISDISKTALKAHLIHASLLHRCYEIAKNSEKLSKEGSIIPALILARAAFETAALLYYTYIKIDAVVKTGDVSKIDDILMRIMFGERQQKTTENIDIPAINILTVIDSLDNEMKKLGVQDIRALYDELCEFAHPNCNGAFRAYAETTKDNPFLCAFGVKPECLSADLPLPPLYLSLLILEKYDEDLIAILPKFTKLHESIKPPNDEDK